LLCDWWNNETIKKIGEDLFEGRLIPLNKKYPNIPRGNEFRPIVVLSTAFKWLALRFMPKLNKYMRERMDKNQIGFVCGTHVNI
jgi:hypothetical protein